MQTQLSGGLEPTNYNGRAKDARPGIAIRSLMNILFGLCCVYSALAQPNLVPNPSFEEFTNCPYSPGHIEKAEPWNRVSGSVDYYRTCGTNGWGVPDNWAGYQEARTGDAYAGLLVWSASHPDSREYIGVSLNRGLDAGKNYRVEFHINLLDCLCFAVRNIGAYLSNGQPIDQLEHLFGLQPQVVYGSNTYLNDKEGWMTIGGIFTAQGGENFITIGNFDDDLNTDTSHVSCELAYSSIGYYLDDVSVIDVDSLVGVEEEVAELINIYPNPTNSHFIIETADWSDRTLRLLDMAGREVLSAPLHASRQSVAIEGIPDGVYVVVVEHQGAIVGRRKLLVQ